MHTITIDLRDCSNPGFSLGLSVKELRQLPAGARVKPLQQLFLAMVEHLRGSGIDVWDVAGALLGASVQDFVDDLAKMPDEAGARAMVNYFKAVAIMMGNMGAGHDNAGLAMLHAGFLVALEHHGPKVTADTLAALFREVTNAT